MRYRAVGINMLRSINDTSKVDNMYRPIIGDIYANEVLNIPVTHRSGVATHTPS